ncbi:NAD(P)/FAD-dependent oxidoreductase [Streptomyces sp. NPDC090022]|uniref:NAD(P)/FAD-dependent oxidoreductase n=1 Tax=Streptomyces sp. NPDC090022 TaxID=3365920 RepID=UPI00382F9EE9
MDTETREYEIVVVGGGAAGLSAALTLGRARRSVLVIDAGHPRNAPAARMHGYLGHDGASPAGLLARGRAEAAGYGVRMLAGTALAADRLPDGGFLVRCDDGRAVRAARLLVATGLVDALPDVPGLAARWGRDVLHCPYCHGWEVRDEPLAVLAGGPNAVAQAQLWRQWSPRITLIAQGRVFGADAYEELAARGIEVTEGRAAGLVVDDDRLTGVVLDGGAVVPCAALVVAPEPRPRAGILASLGLSAQADGTGATALPGVWVAGNVADPMAHVVGAAAAGARAAAALHADLIAEETRRAVAARREADDR